MDEPWRLPLLLAGALGERLTETGESDDDCKAEWILENREKYCGILEESIQSGADIICIPTEYAGSEYLKAFGKERDTVDINTEIAEMSVKKAGGRVLIAGSIGPLRGQREEIDEDEFFDMFYTFLDQVSALALAGVDMFIVREMSSLAEARAAVFACKRFELPVFVTMQIDSEGKTPFESDILSCLICLQELGISGFGFDCNIYSDFTYNTERLEPYAKVPVIASLYEAVEGYNNIENADIYQKIRRLFEKGFGIIEFGKGIGFDSIRFASDIKCSFDLSETAHEVYNTEIILSNEAQVFFLTLEYITFSEPIMISVDMSEEIFEINESNYDVIIIELINYDDAILFYKNSYMLRLPVMFKSESLIAIETALTLYSGRAMIDSECHIERDKLEEIAKKYGAVLY